jgi:hypothetical protein
MPWPLPGMRWMPFEQDNEKRILHGKGYMEDGKAPAFTRLFHLPSTIFHAGRPVSAAC